MTLAGHGNVLCFCSNNYLGLANEDRVVQAGHEGLDRLVGHGIGPIHLWNILCPP